MPSPLFSRRLILIAAIGLSPNTFPRNAANAATQTAWSAPKSYGVDGTAGTGCSAIVENFCDALWAPGFEGNIRLTPKEAPVVPTPGIIPVDLSRAPDVTTETREPSTPVLLGRTDNQTSYSYWLFSKAKLEAAKYLPRELHKRLDRRHYFEKLRRSLASKPLAKMTREDAEISRNLYQELSTLWESSIEELAIDEVTAKHPQFFRLTDEHMPTALSQAYYRAKDRLEADVNVAIWSHHPRWVEMQRRFAQVQREFIALIRAHPGFAPPLKLLWEKRILSIELMIPGSDPELLDDHDRRCATTERNAVYWTLRDRLEICGGYVLNGDPSRTLHHEMAHALGIHRNEVEHLLGSALAHQLTELRDRTCAKDYLSCGDWEHWKSQFKTSLSAYKTSPELDSKYLSCFQKRDPNKGLPDSSTLDYISKEWVASNLEDQAKRDRLIRLTKEEEIIRDGSHHPNPAFLNPCGLYYVNVLRDPLNPSYTLNSFFVNEYRCRAEENPTECKQKPAKCLEDAIERARELELRLRGRELRSASRYSSIRELQRHGYAEDIEEDLADNLGQLAFANHLKSLPGLAERRAVFFSTVAPLCDEPSIAKFFPAEAQVQKKYYLDSHSEGVDRRRKLLIAPVREALGCKMDFEPAGEECNWMKARGIAGS